MNTKHYVEQLTKRINNQTINFHENQTFPFASLTKLNRQKQFCQKTSIFVLLFITHNRT